MNEPAITSETKCWPVRTRDTATPPAAIHNPGCPGKYQERAEATVKAVIACPEGNENESIGFSRCQVAGSGRERRSERLIATNRHISIETPVSAARKATGPSFPPNITATSPSASHSQASPARVSEMSKIRNQRGGLAFCTFAATVESSEMMRESISQDRGSCALLATGARRG
jgi:hypothetical protein